MLGMNQYKDELLWIRDVPFRIYDLGVEVLIWTAGQKLMHLAPLVQMSIGF